MNVNGEVEMDASIMSGKDLSSGAVSAVRCIANPIRLARLVMEKVRVTVTPVPTASSPLYFSDKRGQKIQKCLRSLS